MKKITIRAILFTSYTLILAILFTAYMHKRIYFLNFYILPILVGAYYFAFLGGIGFAGISAGFSIFFVHRAGYSFTDTPIMVQLIIFAVIGIVSGIFQRENNRLNNYFFKASLTDQLTGLYNYGCFSKRISEEISRADRYRRSVGMIMIDIDHFKKYNDTYGHQKGNQVLIKIAELLQKSVRQSDVVFRYGGEEFAVILPETDMGAREIAERLRNNVEKEEFPGKGDEKLHLAISAGVSYHPWPKETQYGLVERSDRALYTAKESGRNRVCVFEG